MALAALAVFVRDHAYSLYDDAFIYLPVIDLVGLTTPAVAKANRSVPPEQLTAKWIGHERHNLEWVLEQKPDIIITTKFASQPWNVESARAGFYADWLILRAIKEGTAPYRVASLPIAEDLHWLVFLRLR